MPAFKVVRSIIINSSIDKVKASLIDFQQWPVWSPWLIMEPETTINYSAQQSQVGASYNWDGELTGAGEMELVEITDNHLTIDLRFQRPFKSSANVFFELEEQSKSTTKVSWNMKSQLPFFLFWMVKKMKVYIGMDYERGLKMLKDYLETGLVPSAIKIDPNSKIQSQHYIVV